jgi:hypothetical protein
VLGALFAATGTFSALITYVVFIAWLFYGWGAVSVYVLRRRFPRRAAAVPRARLSRHARAVRAVRGGAGFVDDRDAARARGGGAAGDGLGVPMFYVWRSRERRSR